MDSGREIKICRYLRKILRMTCIWPLPGEEFDRKAGSYLLVLVPFTASLILPYASIRHIKVLYDGGYSLAEDLSFISSNMQIYIMLWTYVFKQKKIALLLSDLSRFDEFGKPKNFGRLNDRMDFYAKLILGYVTLGLIQSKVSQLLRGPKCRERSLHENCDFYSSSTPKMITLQDTPLLYVSYFFVDFILIYTFVKLPIIVSYHLFEINQHIILRIDHLKEMIRGCFESDSFEIIQKRICKCIRYHIQIISYADRLNDCYTSCMFTHLALTSVVMACITNHIVQDFYPGYVPLLIGWATGLFLACLAGQQLHDASLSIGSAFYEEPWYTSHPRLQKFLIFIIMRSQKPLRISTGSFNYLSYALFLAVMKTSYSFLALLTTV